MLWSWVLAVIGVAGIYFVGRKTIWGWLVLLFNELLWITYADTTMNKKAITIVSLGLALVAIAYVAYNTLSQLKDIDYDLFDIEEDIDHE